MSHATAEPAADVLRRLMQRLFRRFGALATDSTPCGKPLSMAHAHALMVLRSRPDLSQQELGAELCIDKSNVARLCAKMIKAGHLSQRPSRQDRRSRRVSLTPRGERLAREVEVASGARFAALLAAIPSASRSQVLRALALLVAALEALPAAAPPQGTPNESPETSSGRRGGSAATGASASSQCARPLRR